MQFEKKVINRAIANAMGENIGKIADDYIEDSEANARFIQWGRQTLDAIPDASIHFLFEQLKPLTGETIALVSSLGIMDPTPRFRAYNTETQKLTRNTNEAEHHIDFIENEIFEAYQAKTDPFVTIEYIREVIEEGVLDVLPLNWRPLFKNLGLRFVDDSFRFGNAHLLSASASKLKNTQAKLDRIEKPGPNLLKLKTALQSWPTQSHRCRQEKLRYGEIPCVGWTQAFSLLAEQDVHYRTEGMLAWRFNAAVLFPVPVREDRKQRVPVIRITLKESTGGIGEIEETEALSNTIADILKFICMNLGSHLTTSAEDNDHHIEQFDSWPVSVEISLPETHSEACTRIFNKISATSQYDSVFDDTSIRLMSLTCRASPFTKTVVPIERKHQPRNESTQPGQCFTLMEWQPKILVFCENGTVDYAERIKRHEQFTQEYGIRPEDFLKDLKINAISVRKITWQRRDAHIESYVSGSGYDIRDVNEALWCEQASRPKAEQPVFRVLIDPVTNIQYFELSEKPSSITEFLERATASGSVIGGKPLSIKVSSSLQNTAPQISTWADKNAVKMVLPTSGFDAGAKYVRLWNQCFQSILFSARGESYGDPMQASEFHSRLSKLPEMFNAKPGQTEPLFHLPKSFMVAKRIEPY
jgi:hypothetical protein